MEVLEWSYDLGFIAGVYLGDGNISFGGRPGGSFNLSSIDKDFVEATRQKIKKVTNYSCNLRWNKIKKQWMLSFCNRDFVEWLAINFGIAGKKKIKVLPTIEANKGLLEGIMDSEGTSNRYSMKIRMYSNLASIVSICNLLGIRRGPQHKGISNENWFSDKSSKNMEGYSISIKEWTKVGLGTYIKRKAKHGINYKTKCTEQCKKDGHPR